MTVSWNVRHRPQYTRCYDWECCHTEGPVNVACQVCGENWPCATKRSHHTPGRVARIERWVAARLARSFAGGL